MKTHKGGWVQKGLVLGRGRRGYVQDTLYKFLKELKEKEKWKDIVLSYNFQLKQHWSLMVHLRA